MVGVICTPTPPPLQYLKGLFPVPQTKSTRYFLHALQSGAFHTGGQDGKPWGGPHQTARS